MHPIDDWWQPSSQDESALEVHEVVLVAEAMGLLALCWAGLPSRTTVTSLAREVAAMVTHSWQVGSEVGLGVTSRAGPSWAPTSDDASQHRVWEVKMPMVARATLERA